MDSALRPLLVIEQSPTVAGLGRLADVLAERRSPHVVAQAWREDLALRDAEAYGGVVALGGGQHVYDDDAHPELVRERALLADAVAAGVPVLGICLGGQVLARALGAAVEAAPAPEIGWLDVTPLPGAAGDPLLGHLDGPFGVYQWHYDVFDLPDGAAHLATSPGAPNQAFRLGDAWGLQFHPEADLALFVDWLDANPGICARLGHDEAALRAAVAAGSERDGAQVRRVLAAFVDYVEARASRCASGATAGQSAR